MNAVLQTEPTELHEAGAPLRALDIEKRYDGRMVLAGVSLEVGPGSVLGLIGRNLGMWGVDENLDVDPETGYDASNAQGFEYGSVPSARSIGFTVTVRP